MLSWSWRSINCYCCIYLVLLYYFICNTCPHYLINGTIFGRKLLDIKYVLESSLKLLPETFLILRRTERDITIKVRRSSCEEPLFLSDYCELWIFSTDYRKILKHQIQWKSFSGSWVQCGRTDRRMDGQTDMTTLMVAFLNFANTPKNRHIP